MPFEYEEPGAGPQTFGEIRLIRAGGSGGGTRTIWDVKAPFKKFVVVAHDQPMPG